ncbi:hypothetical protein FRB94_010319 [Tulasnella sp. JGI-2019a]|nr:hypothetical protein FRB94_010319 [Tulasnella sp. JGI-2019a]
MASSPRAPASLQARGSPTSTDARIIPSTIRAAEPSVVLMSSSPSTSTSIARTASASTSTSRRSPTLRKTSATSESAAVSVSAFNSHNNSAVTSPSTPTSALPPHVLNHHVSQASMGGGHTSMSLRTMNSQSSLAGTATRTRRQPSANGAVSMNGSGNASKTGTSTDGAPNPVASTSSSATLKPEAPSSKKPSRENMKERSSESGQHHSSKERERERGRFRHTPHMPQSTSAERVPSAMMHWSKAPVHGHLPTRNMRAHTVTVVDHVAWVFGGCDEKGCWRDVWCFDIETFQWTHPDMLGDLPPPCRAHSATLVDRKIYIWGGGEGPTYYNDLYVLDTISHRWVKPVIPGPIPLPRRAHTAVLYKDIIYVFGGGNGHRALNDVWALDTSVGLDRLRWECVMVNGSGGAARGMKPAPRGYHTANLVGEVMVVLGGSDGRECFNDVWVLDLDRMVWREVRPEKTYRRLSHSSTQVGSYLFIMGGHDGVKYSHELLLFNLVTLQFEPRQTQGRPPCSRGYHVAALADSRLWIFGGFDGHAVFDDVWVLDLAAAAYLPQVTSFGIFVE